MSVNLTEQTRQNVRENFFQSLMLAFCEANSELPTQLQQKDLQSQALQIESALYIQFNRQCDKEYTKKFRLLQSTLLATENKLLRSQIFTQKIEPSELVLMSSDSLLAPSKL